MSERHWNFPQKGTIHAHMHAIKCDRSSPQRNSRAPRGSRSVTHRNPPPLSVLDKLSINLSQVPLWIIPSYPVLAFFLSRKSHDVREFYSLHSANRNNSQMFTNSDACFPAVLSSSFSTLGHELLISCDSYINNIDGYSVFFLLHPKV